MRRLQLVNIRMCADFAGKEDFCVNLHAIVALLYVQPDGMHDECQPSDGEEKENNHICSSQL